MIHEKCISLYGISYSTTANNLNKTFMLLMTGMYEILDHPRSAEILKMVIWSFRNASVDVNVHCSVDAQLSAIISSDQVDATNHSWLLWIVDNITVSH